MADNVRIMDFAADDIVPEFYVTPEHHFVCVPDIPLGIMQQIVKFKDLQKGLQETGDMEPLLGLFDQLLEPASASHFRQCVADRVIGVKRIMKIVPWIMEEYGLGHPTQPSPPSSNGQSVDGTGVTSEDGVSQEVLTQEDVLPGMPSI